MLYHGEVVWRDNKRIGYVRAGSYGFTLGGAVGLVMLEGGEVITRAYIQDATWEVEIAGERYPAKISIRPLYDPGMKKIKG